MHNEQLLTGGVSGWINPLRDNLSKVVKNLPFGIV